MKKLILLLEIAALTLIMICAVICGSSYEAKVGATLPIEDIWNIEDTRTESEIPLVTQLLCNGVPAAYSRSENTFYCPLGLDNGETWPQLRLTVPDTKGMTVCFSDDYTYDSCCEAIAEGYSYELFSYTSKEYAYFNIVFTGLPVVSLNYDGEMTIDDTPVSFEFSNTSEPVLSSYGRAHLRGDGSLHWGTKSGYRVEFTRRADGSGKFVQNVPGISATDALLLLPMGFDETLMRDRLSWDMYNLLTKDTDPFSALKTRYAELFVNNEYAGVYLLMEPYDIVGELTKASANAPLTDSVYRAAVSRMMKDRPMARDTGLKAPSYELFHAPSSTDPFAALENYYALWNAQSDEEFTRLALEYMDIDSVLQYLMLAQAAGLADNALNNIYIWAHYQDGRLVYRYEAWDLDRSWSTDAGEMFDFWFVIPLADRIVNLDIDHARNRLREIWQEMKDSGFTYETVESFIAQYTHELNDSGAFMRNTLLHNVNASMADGTKILNYCSIRFPLLDQTLERICSTEGKLPFLSLDVRQGDPTAISMLAE